MCTVGVPGERQRDDVEAAGLRCAFRRDGECLRFARYRLRHGIDLLPVPRAAAEQFIQALEQLAATASGSYIRSGAVSELIQIYSRKIRSLPVSGSAGIAWKDRTLDEITRDAICTVLSDLDGNQSRAARALGISRATLWRALRQEQGKL